MPEGFEIIRARIKDDAAILIDRLMRSKYPDVVLVLPKNSLLAADLNSLKILKEEAESVGKNLSISAENDEIKTFAEKIQLPIYDLNMSKKEKLEFSKPAAKKLKIMTDIVPHREVEEAPIEIELEPELKPEIDLIPQQEPIIYETSSELEKDVEDFYNEPKREKESEDKPHFNRLATAFVGMGILLLASALYLILPRANIKLSLKQIPITLTIPAAVSKNISSPNFVSSILPGQYFSLTKSGSKIIEKLENNTSAPTKAGGAIYIYNAYSDAPQKLVAQTRFETKDGKIFRIQQPVTVPGAKMSGGKLTPSSIKVNVVSDATGEEYLIGPSYFTIPGFQGSPKYAGFYAESAEAMTPISGNSTIASQEIEKTKQDLKNELASQLKDDTLNTFKDSNFKLIDGASTVSIDEFKSDSQTVSMKITWQAIFFNEKDFRALVDYAVSNKYPDLKNFQFEDMITYPQTTRTDFKKGEIFFTFQLDKASAFNVDLAGLKKDLAGLDENGMRNIIAGKNFITSATISLWPFWVKQAPGSLDKINITLDSQ